MSGPAGNSNPVSPQNPTQDLMSVDFQKRYKAFRAESGGKSLAERVAAARKHGIPFHVEGRGEEGCQCNSLHGQNYGVVKIETYEKNDGVWPSG
jgi:hypothetical protein